MITVTDIQTELCVQPFMTSVGDTDNEWLRRDETHVTVHATDDLHVWVTDLKRRGMFETQNEFNSFP